MYTPEPSDKEAFTQEFDSAYSRFAGVYDLAVKWFPIWRNWISHTLPHIRGPRVLEISFGTGYLLSQYAGQYDTFGLDYNWELARTARRNLQTKGVQAYLQQANVEHLPYPSGSFDTVVNTMAFSGYPDGEKAISEMRRVLKDGGRLVMVDICPPGDRNQLGMMMTRMWASAGDIIRDMGALFDENGFKYTDEEIGGFGSVHLFVGTS